MTARSSTVTRWVVSCCSTAVLVGSLSAADKPLTYGQIKNRLVAQREAVKSLHLRVRRATSRTATTDRVAVGEQTGTDLLLEAFKGDKRYRRIMELDYSPLPFGQAGLGGRDKARRYVDVSKAWTGRRLLTREAGPGSRRKGEHYEPEFKHASIRSAEAQDEFPPSSYLSNVGLAAADPTGTSEATRSLHATANLAVLLRQWPYEIINQREEAGGAPCIVLKGVYDCVLPAGQLAHKQRVDDKLWLDLGHSLALRKRETRVGGRLSVVVNQDFVEVSPGVWLPRKSELKRWCAVESAKVKPDFVRTMSLTFWVVNEVPDDLFDVALTPWEPASLFDVAHAFHWRDKSGLLVEGWALKDVGTRIEERTGSGKLVRLVVETPQCRFDWKPTRNHVSVQRSRLSRSDGYSLISPNVRARANVIRGNEVWTAMFSTRTEQLGDRKVERLFAHYPGDPLLNYAHNLHHADPVTLRSSPLPMTFYSRRYWFDLQSKRIVARQCGCKSGPDADSNYEPNTMIDYPDPKGLAPDLFSFKIPANATVSVSDPELQRQLQLNIGPSKRANEGGVPPSRDTTRSQP